MKTAVLCLALFATFYSAQGDPTDPCACVDCGPRVPHTKGTSHLTYFKRDGWNVKLVFDTTGQDPLDGLKGRGHAKKLFLDDRTPYVMTFNSSVCVGVVQLEYSCALKAEVRLLDTKCGDEGKEVVYESGPLSGGPAWNKYEITVGPCCVNRIKIRVWPDPNGDCEPQPKTAIRNVGVYYCACNDY